MKDLKIKRLQFRCPQITQLLFRPACKHFNRNFKIPVFKFFVPSSLFSSVSAKYMLVQHLVGNGSKIEQVCVSDMFSSQIRF